MKGVPSASSEILDRRSRGIVLYFELCYYVDVQDPLNCPQYTGEQLCTQPVKFFCFSDFASVRCQGPPVKFWMVLMVRTWSVSFSGLLL